MIGLLTKACQEFNILDFFTGAGKIFLGDRQTNIKLSTDKNIQNKTQQYKQIWNLISHKNF